MRRRLQEIDQINAKRPRREASNNDSWRLPEVHPEQAELQDEDGQIEEADENDELITFERDPSQRGALAFVHEGSHLILKFILYKYRPKIYTKGRSALPLRPLEKDGWRCWMSGHSKIDC